MQTNQQELSTTQYTCHICGGTGHIGIYNHVAGGECFTCNGSGQIFEASLPDEPIVIKQHTRKLANGSLEFMFWSDGSVQIIHRDNDDEWLGVRSVTTDEAREIWNKPWLYRVSSTFFNQ